MPSRDASLGVNAMRMMRRMALALVVALVAAAPAQAVERVLRFVSDVEVERNGDLAVTETIRVQAEGNQIRRGILRDFPTTYARRDGGRVVVSRSNRWRATAPRRAGPPSRLRTACACASGGPR
jgi:Predicted membrane protein (DUF2207) N-terminal domain